MEDDEMSTSESSDSTSTCSTDPSIGLLSSDDITTDTSTELSMQPFCKPYLTIDTSDSDDDEDISDQTVQEEWFDPIGKQPQIVPFMGKPGFKLSGSGFTKVEDFYLLLVTDDLFDEISKQTNLYASQVLSQNDSSPLNEWVPTSKNEIKSFFGLILWMEVVRLTDLGSYWSKDSIYTLPLPHCVMPCNRFELLLRMLHFTNNEVADAEEPYKIKLIIDALNDNFNKYYDPSEYVYIDETVIPFRGCVNFRKFIKQMGYRYGFRIMKLCSKGGYTHRFRIYTNKKLGAEKVAATNDVISLSEDILDKGHTLCIDDRFTSFDLAQELITRKTHLVGTVRSKSRRLNKEVVGKKLKGGKMFAKEHQTGITFMKWKGKRVFLALSTKHSTEMVTVTRKRRRYTKPALISDYNNGQRSVIVPDPIEVYQSPFREGMKWYKKLAVELLLNVSIVNAWVMYNNVNSKPISLYKFKTKLIMYLCNCNTESNVSEDPPKSQAGRRHKLQNGDGEGGSARHCAVCYKENVQNSNKKIAKTTTKRVNTYCEDCPDKPYLCLHCFDNTHR